MASMATTLDTSHSERRNGVAVSAASAKVASAVWINGRAGEACSAADSTSGTAKRSNRGVESCKGWKTGIPEPANKLAASADKLNKMRAVNERYLDLILT